MPHVPHLPGMFSPQTLMELNEKVPALQLTSVNRTTDVIETIQDMSVAACAYLQTNITRFFATITPSLSLSVPRNRAGLEEPSFKLRDLWRFYDSPSGIEVPIQVDDDASELHFAPHLSGFQLFSEDSVGTETPSVQWFSSETPDAWKGVWETVSELSQSPEYELLMKARSTSLSHHSWYVLFS